MVGPVDRESNGSGIELGGIELDRRSAGFPGQTETPFTDHVALDLVRAAVDGVGPAVKEGPLEAVQLMLSNSL